MTDATKRTWAEINLDAIAHNYVALLSRVRSYRICRAMCVVKANAYGHGAVEVSRLLTDMNCEYLAVACLDEARELRAAGIRVPILILGYTPPVYAAEMAELNLTQAVGSLAMAKALSWRLEGTGLTLRIHLKMETGMGRTGFRAYENSDMSDAVEAVKLPHLEAEGAFTHFCVSDGAEIERDYTVNQYARFQSALSDIKSQWNGDFAIRHCANSGAIHAFPETCMDMIRPGISLYGMYPGPVRDRVELLPAMRLMTRVATVEKHLPGDTLGYGRTFTVEQPSRIAVLPIGYADGLHRVLSNRLKVWINGKEAPQVGRICMDMCMVDVTEVNVRPGDEVEIFGYHQSVEEVAAAAGTIHYEMTCAVSPRVPRVYRR